MIRYHTTWARMCQIVTLMLILWCSCRDRPASLVNLSDYYYPIESIPPEGLVYSYRNLQDSLAPREVWRLFKTGEDRLVSINYDDQNKEVLKQYDRRIMNGIVTDSLVLLYEDSTGRTFREKVKILSPNRFPFEPGDSLKVWLTHLEWWQPVDSLHVVLQRRRLFAGDTTWLWQGQNVPAVLFRTEDTFETERDGWTTSAWTGEEIYAKGKGLVYYRRKLSDQLQIEFVLESN